MKKSYYLLFVLFLFTSLNAQESNNLESKFLNNSRQLIYEGNRSGEGYFSDDGRYLIFQSEREAENPFYQIYTTVLNSRMPLALLSDIKNLS